MKKITNYILFLGIYLLTFLSIQAVTTDLLSFYESKPIIEGVTSRIEFTADLRVTTDSSEKNQSIDFRDSQKYNRNGFIKYENIEILGSNIPLVKFSDKSNSQEFRVKGNLIFCWIDYKPNYPNKITLGKVVSPEKEIGTVDIVLDNLNIVSVLKINIKKHMDFGTIIAGQKASTRESSRTPAEIDVEGTSGQRVKITIPKSAEIKNSSGDILLVDLQFRNTQNMSDLGDKKSIVKNIAFENKNGIGKTDIIKIDGNIATKTNSRGNYKGVFTVRVEYEN